MLQIQVFTFNPLRENTYVLSDDTGEAVVIDPGCATPDERAELKAYLDEEGLTVTKLLNTHGHIDHVLGNAFVAYTTGAPLHLHELDVPTLRAVTAYAPNYGFFDYEEVLPQVFLQEGVPVTFGETTLEVLFVPGHAPGHVAFFHRESNSCFSGDVLFYESIGRYDFPNSSYDDLLHSITQKLFLLADDVEVYPGHGPTTTIGHEKMHNPHVGQNSRLA